MEYVILFALVFLAGFVDSIGGGGGIISLPGYLFVGLPSHLALGTNKLSSTIGTIFSTLRYAKNKAIIFRIALISGLFSFIGSAIGAKLALLVPDKILKIVISVLIVIASLTVFLKKDLKEKDNFVEVEKKKEVLTSSFIGLVIGMYDGFFGPGTGTFLIILYVTILGMPMVTASGSAKVVNLASNIGALVMFLFNSSVIYKYGLPAAFFGILGNWIGSGVAIKNGSKVIKPIILSVLVLLFVKIIIDLL